MRVEKGAAFVFLSSFVIALLIIPNQMILASPSSIDAYLENIHISDPYLLKMFRNTFVNTIQTTVGLKDDNTTYVITGDINAMWVRDSCAQVYPYALICINDAYLQRVVRGVMLRHFKHFNSSYPMSTIINSWKEDYTPWEYKYEHDGIAYLIRLCWVYWKVSGDDSWAHLSGDFNAQKAFGKALRQILDNMDVTTGLVRVSHRPSDDSTVYPFLIPTNMFIAATMPMLKEMYLNLWENEVGADLCDKIRENIIRGIETYAVYNDPVFGRIWAYEVDGRGRYLLMDDANVPSLLSAPYIGFTSTDNDVYQNTRRFLLSSSNPYFFSGSYISGIGSPHTPGSRVWPMSLIVQILTSDNHKEIESCLEQLKISDAGTKLMHESINPNNPADYTRSWFAWANSLFAEMVITKVVGLHIDNGEIWVRPHLNKHLSEIEAKDIPFWNFSSLTIKAKGIDSTIRQVRRNGQPVNFDQCMGVKITNDEQQIEVCTTQLRLTQTPVDLSSYFNRDGISWDNNRGNLDGSEGYDADGFSDNITCRDCGILFLIGSRMDGQKNMVSTSSQTIDLPNGHYSALHILGASIGSGSVQSGTLRVNYQDGSYSNVTLRLSDWCQSPETGEHVAILIGHRHSGGQDQVVKCRVFHREISLDSNKIVENIVLPNNQYMRILAITVSRRDYPILVKPENSSQINDNTPIFSWIPAELQDNQRFLLDDDLSFSSPIENIILPPSVENFEVLSGLPDGRYYWKVVPIFEGEEFDSDVWEFSVDTQPPQVPTPLSPENGFKIVGLSVIFSWSGSENVLYNLQVTTEVTDLDYFTYENQTEIQLPDHGIYYWRIRAMDQAGNWSDWSEFRRLDVLYSWWNQEWTCRRKIEISGNHPENFQIKVVLPSDIENTIYPSIRFLEDENRGFLPYWIEKAENAYTNIVWVRRLENSDNEIWMYYGNPYVTSAENGDNVFLFFDDFGGGTGGQGALNTRKWWATDTGIDVYQTVLRIEDYGNPPDTDARRVEHGGSQHGMWENTIPRIIEVRVKPSQWWRGGLGLNGPGTFYRAGSGQQYAEFFKDGSGNYKFFSDESWSPGNYQQNIWYIASLSLYSNSRIKARFYYGQYGETYRSLLWEAPEKIRNWNYATDPNNYCDKYVLAAWDGGGDSSYHFDWFIVRRQVEKEPIIMLGAEQLLPPRLSRPILEAPENGSMFKENNVLLSWVPGENSLWQRLQIANDPAFDSPFIDVQLENAENSYVLTNLAEGKYYWRIIAANLYYENCSETWEFAVKKPILRVREIQIEKNWIPFGWYDVMISIEDEGMNLENVYFVLHENSVSSSAPDNVRNHYTWLASKVSESWQFSSLCDSRFIDSENCSAIENLQENSYMLILRIRVSKIAAPGNWNLLIYLKDNETENSLENKNAITVQIYIEMFLSTEKLTFAGGQGENVDAIESPLIVTVTTNQSFNVGVRAVSDWTSNEHTISVSATKVKGEGNWISLSTTYQIIWSSVSYGENVQKSIEWRFNIPSNAAPGLYINAFKINVSPI